MNKPIIADLPYPSLDGVGYDIRTASLINGGYAGAHGELTAIVQYIYHHFNFERDFPEISKTLLGISVAEMKHLEILGELLIRLGVDPVFTRFPPYKCDFYSSSFVRYSKTPKKMIMDEITGELVAIEEYTKMLNALDNESVAAIISRIVIDEELHVKVLKDILQKLN